MRTFENGVEYIAGENGYHPTISSAFNADTYSLYRSNASFMKS